MDYYGFYAHVHVWYVKKISGMVCEKKKYFHAFTNI